MENFSKIVMMFKNSFGRNLNADCKWNWEPMDHPTITSMTQRELADLPIPVFTVDVEGKVVQNSCHAGCGPFLPNKNPREDFSSRG